ncbi:hypothetical protein [Streptomyces sp. SID161]|uniref:hypothetical protein n=1 Tax=Streptomyces sp. SID161 TaxID=2690251 RepID=UPI0013683453|nr:hypothetical protein [Streptomyces sp. SID161]MYW49617.1 hypothetical protein [Streptomyces sp. SID161]
MAGSIRARAASAVAKLKQHGEHDEAAAIESLLAPRGYLLLKRTEEGSTDPLSITVSAMLKQAINQTAEEWDLVTDALAEEAYRLVLDGKWVPAEVGRAGTGKRGTKAVLQVNVDSELRGQVQGMLPALSKKVGYRVTEANIVLTHVCEELGIERPNTAAVEQLATRLPRSLRDHFHGEAERLGLELPAIVEDGIRGLLDGKWQPERHPYFTVDKRGPQRGSWSEADRANLKVRVDRNLLASMRARLEELSEQLGYLVSPGTVLYLILTDRLGVPAE